MDASKLGPFIAQLRREQKMTQADLARRLQVTDKAVSRWERGVGLPDINSIEPLAEALGVSVLELMRAERMPAEQASGRITDALDMIRQQRHPLARTALAVLCVTALVLLGDAMGWMGFVFAALPCICLMLSACLAVYGFIRAHRRKPCRRTFLWACMFALYPIALALLLFLAGTLGQGPAAA